MKLASGLILTLLLTSVLTLTFSVQTVTAAGGTIYIRADGSIDPSTAPISTLDNVTYTFVDNINDSIVVERDDIVIDGAGYSMQGDRFDSGVDLTGRTNVTVRNAQISNFYWGISLSSCSRCAITENNITANVYYGIRFYYSNNSNINGNRITKNQIGFNIGLYNSSNNNIDGNDMTNNYGGIVLYSSSNNTISRNNVTENDFIGIELDGSSDNNSVSENKVVAAQHYIAGIGILLGESTRNNISGNSLTNGDLGIWFSASFNNSISGNSITENACGIELDSSFGNNISENNVTDNNWGVFLYRSKGNSISENIFMNDGLVAWYSYKNVVENNTVNGKPLFYLEGVANRSVSGDVGQVVLVNCTNIRVKNLNIFNATIGVQLVQTNNSIVSGNIITANRFCGIWLDSSFGNNISENNVTDNYEGIVLYSSKGNSINGNDIAAGNQSELATGIYLGDRSFDNNISGNNVTDSYYGIRLDGSSSNNITENNAANNLYGIKVGNSDYVSISRNNVTNNFEGISIGIDSSSTISENNVRSNAYGIALGLSGNWIYHNNFIDNSQQVKFDPSGHSVVWNNGCEGNYWSDYNGTDSDGDGIGDTPYIIDAYNQDNYPLMNPYWNPADINHDLKIDNEDVATAAKAYGSFTGYSTWNPHADITGPPGAYGPPDGKVDIRDLALIAKHYGETYP